jgi:phospholipid/cholesterol/gamma-HCH transport system substrate-binding protein
MVENLTLLTEAFAENEDLVDSTLSELGSYSTSLRRVLTDNEQELLSIVGSLGQVTDLASDRIDSVESALANLPEALDALFEVTNRGEFITIQALCFSTGPPPCPTPQTVNPTTVMAGPSAVAALGPEALLGSGAGPLGGLPGLPEGTPP